ncbi:hypothetical protein GCM10022197_26750 [Microlunatus spumicola]|uniref:Uncharacterized protein n=1 Tax=Microlunatus spumicola TaxID=81499 RepID=A0ABP6XM78_9ACTN
MSTPPVSPFVLVGDPTAAACEGDFCAVPEVREASVPEVREPVPVAREADAEASES